MIEAVAHGRLAYAEGERETGGVSVRSYDVSSERFYLYFEESTAKTITSRGPGAVGTFGRCAMANGLSAAHPASQPCMARAG